ncbi:uncharacterized protein TNCV_1887761 [Trichonephila clavipes]|nr:uncharacterized protein TNCV_1887761 [Trichonephila clavipes]
MNFEGYFLRIDWPFGGITLRVEHPKGVLLLQQVSTPNQFPLSCHPLVRLKSAEISDAQHPVQDEEPREITGRTLKNCYHLSGH